ncbi:MAG: diacylglycerol/polyprenol kinase family protein [Promethearchaeota archaeon]
MSYFTLLPNFPLVWNFIFGILGAMIYIKNLIFFMDRMVSHGKLSSDLSRKIIHIAAGSFIWVWLFIDPSDGWSYALNITVPFLFFLTFLWKGFKGSPDDPDVKTMSRTGDPRELLKGTLYFTIMMIVAGTIFFGSYVGMLMMAILGYGDGIAPYIGKRWGKHKYRTFGREKSVEGSIGVLVFSIIGSLIFFFLLGIVGGPLDASDAILADPEVGLIIIVIVIIILGFIAMIIEAFSPADVDNLLIPASTIISLIILDILLSANFVVIFRFHP